MWPFHNKNIPHKTIHAEITNNADGSVNIDVRGQTCPGYLLAINKAMDTLDDGKLVFLFTSYAPCGDDVKAWCKERGHTYNNIIQENGIWKIAVTKNSRNQASLTSYS